MNIIPLSFVVIDSLVNSGASVYWEQWKDKLKELADRHLGWV